jgi:hypothetical protein
MNVSRRTSFTFKLNPEEVIGFVIIAIVRVLSVLKRGTEDELI